MTEIQEKANTIPQELNIAEIRKYTKEAAPLIHCITNPISIHDCANIILPVPARSWRSIRQKLLKLQQLPLH